jgi:hypothetical protein
MELYRVRPSESREIELAESLWRQVNASPDDRQRIWEFASDKSIPDSEKFVVVGQSVPPPYFVVRASSHAEAQARVRAVARMQDIDCPRLFSCRPTILWVETSRV